MYINMLFNMYMYITFHYIIYVILYNKHVYHLPLYYTCYLTCNMYVILYNKYILG